MARRKGAGKSPTPRPEVQPIAINFLTFAMVMLSLATLVLAFKV